MKRLVLAAVLAVAVLLTDAPAAWADGDATSFRVFLLDGTSMATYGEVTRVADRVVFSMRAGTAPDAPLQLINIPLARVDWERTERYAASARANHYIETQAENDYIVLSNSVAQTINDVVRLDDATKRLAMVEQARRALAEWPKNHYNYREAEVRQMVVLLDEAIADLRAATGGNRFDLNLIAYAPQNFASEPMIGAPTPQQTIEQMLTAARAADSSADRTLLLQAVVDAVERERQLVDEAWAASVLAATQATIDAERRLDREYQVLAARTMLQAEQRARQADVRGIERVLASIRETDAALGRARPEALAALTAAVEEQLDGARRLRLARDRWMMRAGVFGRYRVAIDPPIAMFVQLRPALEDIKALAGSSPIALATIERLVGRIVAVVSSITPPDEFNAAQALLLSAAHLAQNAAQIRRDATVANDIARAWDASAAAAGALMLSDRAREDIYALLRPPSPR